MCTRDEGKDKDIAYRWNGTKNQTSLDDLSVNSAEEPAFLGDEASKKTKTRFQDRLQLVSKCNCYTHLLHKCSVQLCSPKFSEEIRKKGKNKIMVVL